MNPKNPLTPEPQIDTYDGIPHRLLDDYDCDGKPPTSEEMAMFLAEAPPEVIARIAEYNKAKQIRDRSASDIDQRELNKRI